MDRKTKYIALSIGAAVLGIAACGVIAYTTTQKLVRIAIDRKGVNDIEKLKKARKKMRGHNGCEAFSNELASCAEKLRRQEHEVVEILAADQTRLVGHWFPCKDARRVIVAMHGWRSSWDMDFGIAADFWRSHGCSVLYAEQRGQNNSGGDYMGFGLIERHDCPEWAKWVNGNVKMSLPIYFMGVSMGATTVLMASDLDLPDNVCGIIADCGFTSPQAIWRYVVEKNLHMSYRLRSRLADDLCRKRICLGASDFSATDALKHSSIPVLFVHGSDDHFVPVEMTYENYKACAAPKRLLIVPGADHGMSYYVDPDAYRDAILRFWNDFE